MANKTHANGNHKVGALLQAGHSKDDVMFSKSKGSLRVHAYLLRGKHEESEEDAVKRLSDDGWDIGTSKYIAKMVGKGLHFTKKAPKTPAKKDEE